MNTALCISSPTRVSSLSYSLFLSLRSWCVTEVSNVDSVGETCVRLIPSTRVHSFPDPSIIADSNVFFLHSFLSLFPSLCIPSSSLFLSTVPRSRAPCSVLLPVGSGSLLPLVNVSSAVPSFTWDFFFLFFSSNFPNAFN